MSTSLERPPAIEMRNAISALRGNWVWFVLLGLALVVLGTAALGAPWIGTLASTVAIGALLVVGGVAETVGAIWSRGWSGFFVHLLDGLLSALVGLIFLSAPVDAALAVTLPLACLMIMGGVFKIVAALNYRFAAWGWPLVSGVVDVVLGALILAEWPVSGFWVIGVLVGINLLFRGFSWIGLGVALGTFPAAKADES